MLDAGNVKGGVDGMPPGVSAGIEDVAEIRQVFLDAGVAGMWYTFRRGSGIFYRLGRSLARPGKTAMAAALAIPPPLLPVPPKEVDSLP